MAEGVFLWARLVARSLLAGILRRDTAETLKKKLSVTPRDLTALYNQLLESMESDDRNRAYKTLLLTAHNPSWSPLDCAMYYWIDSLSDPNFPPTDGKKPCSWPSMESVTASALRQITSLTKGLLKTTITLYPNRELSKTVVHSFHRTAQEFVRSKVDFSNFLALTSSETYHRLLLAHLTLGTPTYRIAYWNGDLRYPGPRFPILQGDIPLALVNGFSLILNDSPVTLNNTLEIDFFRGLRWRIGSMKSMHRLLFFHLAAYYNQQLYVFQEISKHPELLHSDGAMHILLSAAMGGALDMAAALLRGGSSLADQVLQEKSSKRVPLWMVFVVEVINLLMICTSSNDPYLISRWRTLELFLQHKDVDVNECLLLLRE